MLLDAALALLAERGADGVSVRGIAARLGVAPNAVYTYFPDKAAVLQALAEQLLGRVNHDKFIDPARPWRHRIRACAPAPECHWRCASSALGWRPRRSCPR
jgi:AcrR family transcriptional regulator